MRDGNAVTDGGDGGLIAGAAMAAWAAATAFWMGVGAVIWRLFFEPRIAELKEALATEKTECEIKLAAMAARADRLEGVLLFHGPPEMRNAMQAALSEVRTEMDEVRK